MKTVVIGSGSWGTALAQVLLDNKQECIVYGRDLDEVVDIHLYHQNSKYFPDVTLHPDLDATRDIKVVADCDVVVLAVPTIAIEAVCKEISPILKNRVIVINTSKGFHPVTHKRMSEVISESINAKKLLGIVSLLGPSHAEEVVQRLITSINAVSYDEELAKKVQHMFANEYFRVYYSTDVIGSEIAASIKNIIALGSGIAEGLGLGDNAKAALMTRGLVEMKYYGMLHGAQESTFAGLSGIGDLIVTCTSKHSRNFQAGYQIGCANSAAVFWENNVKTVEGVRTCEAVYLEAKKEGIVMPITEAIYKVLYENGVPSECVTNLMTRDLKRE